MELDKLGEALAKAQVEMTNPPRNREVEVSGKTESGSTYKYKFKYATLDAIIDHVRKPLTDNGLWFVQTIEGSDNGGSRLVTTLLHSSGQSIRSETPLLAEKKGNQGFGSALTYMRRYALTAMLGIAADEDDDANAADGNTITESREREKPRGNPAPANTSPALVSGNDPRFVSEDQQTAINDLVSETKADKAAFLKFMKVESVADIPSDQYAHAIAALEKKRKAA